MNHENYFTFFCSVIIFQKLTITFYWETRSTLKIDGTQEGERYIDAAYLRWIWDDSEVDDGIVSRQYSCGSRPSNPKSGMVPGMTLRRDGSQRDGSQSWGRERKCTCCIKCQPIYRC